MKTKIEELIQIEKKFFELSSEVEERAKQVITKIFSYSPEVIRDMVLDYIDEKTFGIANLVDDDEEIIILPTSLLESDENVEKYIANS